MQKSVKLVVCGGPAASMGTSCHSRPEEVGFEVEGQDDAEVDGRNQALAAGFPEVRDADRDDEKGLEAFAERDDECGDHDGCDRGSKRSVK